MRRITIIFMALCLASCSADMEIGLDGVRAGYANGEYAAAAQNFTDKTDFQSMDNLELLITADSLFHTNDFAASDAAFEEFNARNIDLTGGDIGRETRALVAGNMANDYRPYMMDALFVSYYQLWNALAMGDNATARVIINQSYARQQEMSREYAELVSEIQSAADENADVAARITYENSSWAAFRDIMNPALMYLGGIYFLNNGDFSNAKTYLRRADGMMPDNKCIASDLDAATAKHIPTNTVWFFIEDGFAPKLHEERMDMPFFTNNGTTMISIALSEPLFFPNDTHVDGACPIADVDALFMTEYTQYRVNEVLRAFASASSKAALQSAMYNSNSDSAPLLGLIANIYTMASTNAEIRSWATLPGQISVLRVARPKSGLIEIKSNGNVITTANLDAPGNYLVYVRIIDSGVDTKVIKIK